MLVMTDFPRIINTEIIDTETDIFWYNNSASDETISPKHVLILSKKIDEQSAEQQQLNKILDACKLSEDKYNLVQITDNERRAWHLLKDIANPSVIILFGVRPSDLGISALFRLNGLNNFDGASWIPTLSLSELEQQPQAKKDLWASALKPLFADTQ
jgi:hypothetical protein